eukprot:361367-Chlamydomonas_euryale.AAC.2
MTPTQLSVVTEALGKAGVQDAELFGKIATTVSSSVAKFSGAELARTLWGFAAAGAPDGLVAKAACKALTEKAGELSGRDAAQAVWALAKLRRTDKATLDALVRAAKGRMNGLESVVDAAALAWSLGYLNYKADAGTVSALAGALKAGAASLTPAHAIDAAWGLGVLGCSDAAAGQALLDRGCAALAADPAGLDAYSAGSLYNAAAMIPGTKLPDQVAGYAAKMYALGAAAAGIKTGSAGAAFEADLAAATARAFGARYRPEVAAAVRGFATTTPEGLAVGIALDASGTKVAVEPLHASAASATHPGVALGPAAARAKLLEAAGYKVAMVSAAEWSGLGDDKTKAAAVLKAAKAAGINVGVYEKKLAEPFNAYA